VKNGKHTTYKFVSLGRFLDDALDEALLPREELIFYDALADNESAVRELGDATLKKIALELTEKLRNNTSVDWQKRESVRARLRNLVRITLRHAVTSIRLTNKKRRSTWRFNRLKDCPRTGVMTQRQTRYQSMITQRNSAGRLEATVRS
jgi:type I restriction enzyme R subunit